MKEIKIKDIVTAINIGENLLKLRDHLKLNDEEFIKYSQFYFKLTDSLGMVDDEVREAYKFFMDKSEKLVILSYVDKNKDLIRLKLIEMAYQYFEDFKDEKNKISTSIFYSLCVLENGASTENEVRSAKMSLEKELSFVYGTLDWEDPQYRNYAITASNKK